MNGRRRWRELGLGAFLVVQGACGAPDPCADVELGDTGVLLELTPETHEGWGQPTCLMCHVRARLHDGACLPGDAVSLRLLQRDDRGCAECHGNNGAGLDGR